jgi:hypothetical protein
MGFHDRRIKVTKGQFKALLRYGIGCGVVMMHNGPNEVYSVEFSLDREGQMRRVADGGLVDLKANVWGDDDDPWDDPKTKRG